MGGFVSKARRISTVLGITSTLILAVTPSAFANWESEIENARPGFESRRWEDRDYSEVNFIHCSTSGSSTSTHIRLWRSRDWQPDPGYDSKRFTECFSWGDGDEKSTGEWHDLPGGNYYFSILEVDDDVIDSPSLDVKTVTVDNTAAD